MKPIITRRQLFAVSLGVALLPLIAGTDAEALEVGEVAPDFTLTSTTGDRIRLSQFRGKKLVLVEFYGSDHSPT